MNQVNKVSYLKGMNMDISKSKYPQNSYHILSNGTIISGDSNDATEISTIEGNTSLLTMPSISQLVNITYYTSTLRALIAATSVSFASEIQEFLTSSCPNWIIDASKRLTIIGYVNSFDRTFLFCKELETGNYSSIFEMVIDDTKEIGAAGYITLKLKYINDSLKFGYIGTEAECIYENENITHLYWADGVNQLRMYNVTDETRFFKHYTQLDQIPETTISIVKLRDVTTSGSLPVGMVQYSYQYFNRNGQSSVYMPLCEPIHLTTEPEGIKLYNEYKARLYHGAESGISSGKSVRIEITDVDTRYDCIRVIQVFHSSISQSPSIKIIAEQEIIDSSNIPIIDDGNKFIGNLSIAEFTKTITPIIPKTIATKDNILFAGNVVEANFKSDNWDNFCTRSYRFNSSKQSTVFVNESPNSNSKTVTSSNGVTVSNWNGLDDDLSEFTANLYNVPSLSDPSASNNYAEDLYQYKYMADGCTLGGTGPNIDFKFNVKVASVDNGTSKSSADVHEIKPIYDEGVLQSQTVAQDNIFTNDYKSPYIASKYKTYQRDDIYRFALVVHSKLGSVSEPKWIVDMRIPTGVLSAYAQESDTSWDYSSFVGQQNQSTNMNILGIDFKITFPQALLNEIQGYSIVRCKRDNARHILGNGLLSPYIFSNAVTDPLPLITSLYNFHIKWNPSNRDSLTRKKTSKNVDAHVVSNSFHNIQGYIGEGAHNYHGFSNHGYTYVNEDSANYPKGTKLTDTGISAFICPEHIFTDNVKLNTDCKVIPTSLYRTVNYLAGVPTAGCLWSDYASELLFMDGVKLSPNVSIKKPYPLELDSFEYTDPLEDYKVRKLFHTSATESEESDYTLVNGLTYGTNPMDHLSFGTNIMLNVKEQLTVTKDSKLVSPLRAIIKDSMELLNKSSNYDETSDQFLINCYLKQYTTPYNGQTLSSILNSEYISTGCYISTLQSSNGVWLSNIAKENSPAKEESSYLAGYGYFPVGLNNSVGSTVFGGDIFLSMFQYLSQYGTDLTTEPIETPVARYTTTLLFPVESTINCNLRHDLDIFTISKNRTVRNIGEKAMFRAMSKAGSDGTTGNGTENDFYHDFTQEKDLYLYNTVFSKENSLVTYTPIINRDGITYSNTTRVMASLPKLNGEYNDSWSKFGVNAEIELPTNYGDLCKLFTFKDVLYGFQSTGIARLAVNDKSTSMDPNNPLIVGTTGVLPYYQYVVSDSGTNHKYSIVSTEDTLMYFDSYKNRIFYLTGEDGDLSSILGLNSYFIENEVAKDSEFPSIISVYDSKNKQILFRLRYKDTNKYSNVLVFNKMLKIFTNFIEIDPDIYINTNDKLLTQSYSSEPVSGNYNLYLENKGLQNVWYNNYNKLKCTLVVNPTTNEFIKMFDFLEFMTTSKITNDTNKFNVLNLPITSIRVYNDYQDTLPIDLITLNSRDQYFQKQRNRTFRVSRLRDKLDTSPRNMLARIKDYYIFIDIEFDKESLSSQLNTEDIKFTLQDLFISYRDLKTTQL